MAKIANKIFEAMNELAEARHVYQRQEPKFALTPEQKKKMKKHLASAKKAISEAEKMAAKK